MKNAAPFWCRSLCVSATLIMMAHAEPIDVGQVVAFTPGIRGAVELVFPSQTGKYYQVQISSDMATWDNEGYSVKGTGGQVSALARTRNLPQAYYRLRDDGSPANVAPVSTESIVAAGGALANLSNVDAATGRAALGAQSNRAAFLERFSRLPNGTIVTPGTAPETGGNWQWHFLGGSSKPYIERGALRAVPGSTYYLGGPVGEPITTFTAEIEWRPSVTYPGGQTNNGFVIGLSPSKMIDEDAGKIELPANMLHLNMLSSGFHEFGIGKGKGLFDSVVPEGATVPYVNWGPTSYYTMQLGRRYVIHVEVDTPRNECRVTAMGKTWKFKDPRIGASGPYTDFYVEATGDSQGGAVYDRYCALHKMWINAPALDQAPGWGAMPYNDALASISSGAVAQLPMSQLKLPGYVEAPVSGENINDRLVVGGRAFVGGTIGATPIAGYGRYPVTYVIQSSTSALVSGANANDAAMFQLKDVALPNNGDSVSYEVLGYFGSNANTKRIKIESPESGIWFDTGALTENGTAFTFRMTRTKVSGTSHMRHGEFQTSAKTVIQRAANNYGGAADSLFRVTGITAGSVNVTSVVATYRPAGT